MKINKEQIEKHGLKLEEYNKIKELLGRDANLLELGIFSAMWNEHCSYKSSKIHLKKLPIKNSIVIQGPGENAGVIDIGDDDAIIFKIESHNHPSFIEPYQGAATGVGGILRDVFTMGARPIALMNSIHFGSPTNKNTQNLHLQVAGIWDPYQLNDFPNDSSKTNFSKLLEELDLKDNYFSVRGELVFVNTQKKEIVIKICPAIKSKKLKNKNFKLVIKGELSLELLHSFVSLDINRDGNSLKLINYEVIEKNLSKNN